MSQPLPWHASPRRHPSVPATRRALALLLRAASLSLDGLARRLEARRATGPPLHADSVIEFHADAGAPEGALYVDGRLVGWIDGINRL